MTEPARYPATRLRRTRRAAWSRALVRETTMTPADLVWPLFVTEGDAEEPVASLPGVSRWPVAMIGERAREAAALGIPAIALFPNTPDARRSERGDEALEPGNLVCRAIRAAKDAAGESVGVVADVALDPYTTHGQDGLLAGGEVLNDETVAVLVDQALNQVAAGADVVAPSDMMDGRVHAIRLALEANGHAHTQIWSYAAKFASAFYGPFRDAVGSGDRLVGDKRGYQMDPANGREALREIAFDLAEGADAVLVKPGLAYLDVIARAAERFDAPILAYQVSGEHAMIELGAKAGLGTREVLLMEKLLAFKRAGCAGVFTYHAPLAARLLGASA